MNLGRQTALSHWGMDVGHEGVSSGHGLWVRAYAYRIGIWGVCAQFLQNGRAHVLWKGTASINTVVLMCGTYLSNIHLNGSIQDFPKHIAASIFKVVFPEQ